MTRLFGGRTIELLAPAGTFEIFRNVIDTGCDAVYCGGRALNMRMIRRGYNLDDGEIAAAAALAHDRGKKIYITVNSLIDRSELDLAREYLTFLASVKPDALIVQDMAMLTLARELCPGVALHASVMANVHNSGGAEFLARHGVTRVVLSRETSLQAAREIAAKTRVELEYFTHGDMCAANGSLCWYSSYLFGQSSNRGRCLKPCRWPFELVGDDAPSRGPGAVPPFPLAVKDMNMFARLPDLLASGISSLKIEGRMRQAEFIVPLVNAYAEALDRFLEDPLGTAPAKSSRMGEFIKRDYSTGYAFGVPGRANINSRGEGTGKLYSTGKMFSQPTAEREIVIETPESGLPDALCVPAARELTVRVNSLAQARLALEYGPKRVYLSAEPLLAEGMTGETPEARRDDALALPKPGDATSEASPLPGKAELAALHAECRSRGCGLFVALPRMLSEAQTDLFRQWIASKPSIDGVLVTHAGSLSWLPKPRDGFSLAGDWSLNVYNGTAARFYADEGLASVAASAELPFAHLAAFPKDCGLKNCVGEEFGAEVVLHGFLPVMYLDHDISLNRVPRAFLKTPEGRLTALRDAWSRVHLFPAKEMSLLPRMTELAQAGFRAFRAEIQAYGEAEARSVLAACRAAIDSPDRGRSAFENLVPSGEGFTYGAHGF